MADFDFDDLWPAPAPPPGFASRVLAARKRSKLPAYVAAALCACLALLGLWRALGRPATGAAETVRRESIALHGRGVAVAEAGSSLRWTVERSGAARVAQDAGDVFYRVEPGGPFLVGARGVEIVVTGTCFEVEVVPMRSLLSAAAGALVASAVVVTVYEGKVVVHRGEATAQVFAGQQARAEPDGSVAIVEAQRQKALPAPPPSAAEPAQAAASREQLIERERAARQQLAGLQERVSFLEKEAAALRARAGDDEPHGPADLPPNSKFHDFTAAELQAMAENCEVRADLPPLDGPTWKLSPEQGARLHLADDEQARVSAAVNKVRDQTIAKLRALYAEASGDAAGAAALAPSTLGTQILQKAPAADTALARARIARERAGLEPPPQDPGAGTIAERYFRLVMSVGDSLQRELEPALGAQQAGRVRDRVDGSRMTINGCDATRAPGEPP